MNFDFDLDSEEDKQTRENQHRHVVNQLPGMGSMFSKILEAITSTNSLRAEPPFQHLMLGQYLSYIENENCKYKINFLISNKRQQ